MQNMCIQNRGIKNNGCGASEVTSNVHEVVGYQLDDIRIYLSTEFGNRSIESKYEIPTRWYYADPECFGTGYSYADI